MAYFWLFCVFISNIVIIVSTTTETCEKTLSLCTLNGGDESFVELPQIGPKGEKGDLGEQGERGIPGIQGIEDISENGKRGRPGFPGLDGLPGLPGFQGVQGDEGSEGSMGLPGSKGVKGDAGRQGPRGTSGSVGLIGFPGLLGRPGITGPPGYEGKEGDMGIPGLIGPPGPPGKNGSCPCSFPAIEPSSDFGDVDNPAQILCKASKLPVKTGEYFIGPYPIKVECLSRPNMTTLTCIPPLSTKPRTFTYEKKLWLSQKGLTIEEIYGINRDQLNWLQSSSNSAIQTIRYHCLNSNPFPRDNANNSLLLLSWNDNTIGPMPTLTKPFFYTVLPETDGCSTAKDSEWSFTDIILVSNSIPRVPVIDFSIRDIRHGKTQSVKIEHIKLCFD